MAAFWFSVILQIQLALQDVLRMTWTTGLGTRSPGSSVPPSITLVPLPPKCPELNPIENVWQVMRNNWLSNRVFRSYDDILDHCCDAWNKLVEQPWRIMSIGLREWAHRF